MYYKKVFKYVTIFGIWRRRRVRFQRWLNYKLYIIIIIIQISNKFSWSHDRFTRIFPYKTRFDLIDAFHLSIKFIFRSHHVNTWRHFFFGNSPTYKEAPAKIYQILTTLCKPKSKISQLKWSLCAVNFFDSRASSFGIDDFTIEWFDKSVNVTKGEQLLLHIFL